jgi:hypothetical protein
MLVVRDVFHCKPGKVRPMVEKFVAMKKIGEKAGLGSMKIMTDVSGQKFWTIVAEMEVESLEKFMAMDSSPELAKDFEQLMKGYHDLVDSGHREVYKLEG